MMKTALPVEFQGLAGKVDYVQRWTKDEYSSSCPQCGGVPHRDGSYPDRFRLFLNASGKNKIIGWCRSCGYVWFPDRDNPVSKEDFEKWRQEQLAREQQRKREAERAIQLLQSEKIWEAYHGKLNPWAIETIGSWGITKDFADYWQLGLIPDYVVHSASGEYHSPAISIPVWQPGWKVSNVKVRVLNPRSGGDRYRKLYKTGQDQPFVAWPDLKSDVCFIAEGEKKAMVVAEWADRGMQVMGVPTKTPSTEMLAKFDSFKKLILCLDPDARKDGSLVRMVSALGKFRTNVLTLPGKVDDMISQHGLDIMDALRYARPLEV